MDHLLQGCVEEFAQHLLEEVPQIHPHLDPALITSPKKMLGEKSHTTIWECSELLGPEEVDRFLNTMSLLSALLIHAPAGLSKRTEGEVSSNIINILNTV